MARTVVDAEDLQLWHEGGFVGQNTNSLLSIRAVSCELIAVA